jgi:hypothetical protein
VPFKVDLVLQVQWLSLIRRGHSVRQEKLLFSNKCPSLMHRLVSSIGGLMDHLHISLILHWLTLSRKKKKICIKNKRPSLLQNRPLKLDL